MMDHGDRNFLGATLTVFQNGGKDANPKGLKKLETTCAFTLMGLVKSHGNGKC